MFNRILPAVARSIASCAELSLFDRLVDQSFATSTA
jgi:hypothetical protein